MMRTSLGLCVLGLFLLGSAATQTPDEEDQPTIHLTKEWTGQEPTGCGADQGVRVRKGSLPRGATPLVTISLKSDRPTPLSTFEGVLAQWAASHCLDGVSLKKAEGPTGANAFEAVVATGWVLAD